LKNTGKDYESLVEDVFKQIMEQDNVQTLKIEKNKIIQGKTTTHEIDVYWEFFVGRIQYTTIIQAKDWGTKVPQGEILKLKSILEDIPGQPRGVFVTKTGYQKGAVDVANANGIMLYELRKPTEQDWKGRIKTIHLNFHAYVPSTKVEMVADNEWVQEEAKRRGLEKLSLTLNEREDQLFIKDNNGNNWKSFQQISQEEHAKIGMQVVKDKEVVVEMDDDKYIDTNAQEFPRIKIKAVKLILSVSLIEQTSIIDGTTIVGFILQNLSDGSEITFDTNGKLRPKDV